MNVIVNGKPRELPADLTVQGLLESLKMEIDLVAVEHNRAILPKARFAETVLRDGDAVEIVHFVGGG
jgi:thiamine biosynthesis protein ThiS